MIHYLHDKGTYLSTGYRCDELGSILSDALILILLAHHEAGDVLHEQDGDVSLATQLNEMRTLSYKRARKLSTHCQGIIAGVRAFSSLSRPIHAFPTGRGGVKV